MQALQVVEHGNPAQFCEVEKPIPQPGEILIRIKACGINFSDLLLIKGTYQETPTVPFSLGMECAGIVETVGSGVTGFTQGDRVAVYCGHGGLAEFGAFPAETCRIIPDSMTLEQAGGFQITYGTSHLALHHRAKLSAGDTVVVLGAAGGVGLTAVEIAKGSGAVVIAVARGMERLKTAKLAGADYLLDIETSDLRAEIKKLGGAHIVYDAVGGRAGTEAFRALRPQGRYIVIGFASGEQPDIPMNIAMVKNIDIIGVNWGAYKSLDPRVLAASMNELYDMFAQNKLAPVIGQTFPFEKALEALECLQRRQATGKIVVTLP